MTLLTLGPLTNVAIAVNLYPELVGLVGEIVIMGGGIETGNVTPFAEFNFYADPESVQFVLDSGIPLSVLTWDATLTVVHTEQELAAAGFGDSASGRLFLDLQRLPFSFFEKRRGTRATMLPDPLTAAYLVDRTIAAPDASPAACAWSWTAASAAAQASWRTGSRRTSCSTLTRPDSWGYFRG